ncbi:MAG: hypothetical protein ACO24H_05115 [Polynucleobacter sp.]|jgi:hypothetical protein
MAYEIEARKVAGVIIEANEALNGKGFNHGEVILGLSELIGRIIVECSETSIQTQELVKVVETHLAKTIQIGSQATQKSLIQGV